MPTVIATPGASNANSYVTRVEFNAYIADRLHVPLAVTAATDDQKDSAIIMATRSLDQILTEFKRLEILKSSNGMTKFYVVRPHWTGSPTTSTQSLAWPRTGMFDRNGNPIADNIIPQDLKNATCEMAILWLVSDQTVDNQVIIAGITSLKAGPVALDFKDYIQTRTLPNSVYLALVPSWLTDEAFENVPIGRFGTIGLRDVSDPL